MQTFFPILRYNDARGAIRSLCATFGFVKVFSVPGSGRIVRHAQLKLGTNVLMLGSARPDELMASPQMLGAATQALYVYIDGPRRAFRTGAFRGRGDYKPDQRNQLWFTRIPRP